MCRLSGLSTANTEAMGGHHCSVEAGITFRRVPASSPQDTSPTQNTPPSPAKHYRMAHPHGVASTAHRARLSPRGTVPLHSPTQPPGPHPQDTIPMPHPPGHTPLPLGTRHWAHSPHWALPTGHSPRRALPAHSPMPHSPPSSPAPFPRDLRTTPTFHVKHSRASGMSPCSSHMVATSKGPGQ